MHGMEKQIQPEDENLIKHPKTRTILFNKNSIEMQQS